MGSYSDNDIDPQFQLIVWQTCNESLQYLSESISSMITLTWYELTVVGLREG